MYSWIRTWHISKLELPAFTRARQQSSRKVCPLLLCAINGGRSHVTSAKIWDFWTTSPLSLSYSRNLSVLSSALDPTPPQCGRRMLMAPKQWPWTLFHPHACAKFATCFSSSFNAWESGVQTFPYIFWSYDSLPLWWKQGYKLRIFCYTEQHARLHLI